MAGTLLPHEFEIMLGRFLSLARRSVVLGPQSSDESISSFFSFWSSTEDMLKKACQVAGRLCDDWIRGEGRHDAE